MFLKKGALKICSKFTEEHTRRSAISTKLLCNFIEIVLRHECSLVDLLHICRTHFSKSTSVQLLLAKPYQISSTVSLSRKKIVQGLLLNIAIKRNRYEGIIATKTTLIALVLVQVKKRIVLVQLKKLSEEWNTGISSKYLINTLLLTAEWRTLRSIDLTNIKIINLILHLIHCFYCEKLYC